MAISARRLAIAFLPLLAAAVAQADPPAAPPTPARPPAAQTPPQPPPASSSLPTRGRLGLEVQSMTDALREYFQAPPDRGVLVVRVAPERPAAQAGLLVGDVLISAGGETVDVPLDLIGAVARVPAGQKLALEVVRKGKTETIEVAPEGEAIPFSRPEAGPRGWGALREHVTRGIREGTGEIIRRLDDIEHRLDRIEKQRSGGPGEERT